MAKEFYTVKVIPHLGNETGEYDHVPTFEVRIDQGGKEKSSTPTASSGNSMMPAL